VPDGAPTLQPLLAVFLQAHHRAAFANSLLLAALVGGVGTALGFAFALTATRAGLSERWVRLLDAATLLSLVSPPFTTSISFLFSFGPRGLITHDLLGLSRVSVYGLTSTAAAEILTYFPLAYLTLRPILAGIEGSIEDAAFSLGASRWQVFRTVTMPLAIPGFANAFLLLFAASLADFGTPLILAGNQFPVLPTEAYLQITGMLEMTSGAALSFALLVPATAVYLLQRYWVGRGNYVTITGKSGARSGIARISFGGRSALIALCVAVALFMVFLYALLFYASIVVAFGANNSLTLAHYHVIFTEGLKAIVDTLIIAGIGMPLGGAFGVLVGYLVTRGRFAGRQLLEITSMINYALPGTIVGIAYLIAFNDPPIELTGTALIIIACYVFRYSPSGIRATIALLSQIDRSIEEASQSLGARSATTFRRIMLPLLVPAFFAGLGVVFIRSMTAISATIFLVSIGWTLVTVRILENMTELSLGPAAAFSVFVIVVVLAVLSAVNALLRRYRASVGMTNTGFSGA
jgi:iron(III) transport system permease protein